MSTFDLEAFVSNPTLSHIDSSRKDDLAQIASRFGISYPKHLLEKELKTLIIGKLVEMEVVLPVQEPAVLVGSVSDSLCEGESSQKVEDDPHVASADGEIGGAYERPKTPFTLPRYDPLSSASTGSRDGVKLKVRLTCLQMEVREKAEARQAQLEYQLEIKRMETEVDKAVRLHQRELASQRDAHVPSAATGMFPSSTLPPRGEFDVSKHIALVPPFREAEVNSYFGTFERIALALHWPPEAWALLLQCKLHGKAQEAVASLPVEDSLNFKCVKNAILRAYELVPEAYRQKFRNHKKTPQQTYVEFASEKGTLFNKWSSLSRVVFLVLLY